MFKILEHPADIGIKVYSNSLEELFINAALGTTYLIVDPETISGPLSKNLKINGKSYEELFTNFLDEVIFLFDSEGFLLNKVKNLSFKDSKTSKARELNTTLEGEKFNKEKHSIKLYLKAVTYHQLEIKQTKEGWEATVYFDV